MEGMTNLTNGTGAIVTGGNGNPQVTNGTLAGVVTDNGSQNGSTGSGRSTPSSSDSSPGKLFVGGLSWQTTPDKLRDYFGQFGTVTDVLVMKDPVTQVNKYIN
jgi:RNA-binding protein Musashi